VPDLIQIDAVLLDYGKVLGLAPRDQDFETLRGTSGIDAAAFPSAFWKYRDLYDRGSLDGPAFWGMIARDANISFTSQRIEELIAQDIQLWIHPNTIMVRWARLLRQRGLKTAVLSNMPREHSRFLAHNAKWLQEFNHLCFSGELRCAKPDAAIYRACLQGLHVPAAQALFIDDHEIHVRGASAVGLHSLVFHSVERLEKDLEPFGLAESFAEAVASLANDEAGSGK
jgi:putative hydrolase of the HAD superfamily